jgi:hypothetical protein
MQSRTAAFIGTGLVLAGGGFEAHGEMHPSMAYALDPSIPTATATPIDGGDATPTPSVTAEPTPTPTPVAGEIASVPPVAFTSHATKDYPAITDKVDGKEYGGGQSGIETEKAIIASCRRDTGPTKPYNVTAKKVGGKVVKVIFSITDATNCNTIGRRSTTATGQVQRHGSHTFVSSHRSVTIRSNAPKEDIKKRVSLPKNCRPGDIARVAFTTKYVDLNDVNGGGVTKTMHSRRLPC